MLHDVRLDIYEYYFIYGMCSSVPKYVGKCLLDNMDFKLTGLDNYEKKIVIIFGEEDNVVLKSSIKGFAKTKKNIEVLLYKETGHLPFFEKKSRFNNDIDKFLTKILN